MIGGRLLHRRPLPCGTPLLARQMPDGDSLTDIAPQDGQDSEFPVPDRDYLVHSAMDVREILKELATTSKKEWVSRIEAELDAPDVLERLSWEAEPGVRLNPLYTSEDWSALVDMDLETLANAAISRGRQVYGVDLAQWVSGRPTGAVMEWIGRQEKDAHLFLPIELTHVATSGSGLPFAHTGFRLDTTIGVDTLVDAARLQRPLILDAGLFTPWLFDRLAPAGPSSHSPAGPSSHSPAGPASYPSERSTRARHSTAYLDPWLLSLQAGISIPDSTDLVGWLLEHIGASTAPTPDTASVMFAAQGDLIAQCGGTVPWELALTLASVSEFIHAGHQAGLSTSRLVAHTGVRLSARTRHITGVSSFRAMRLLWNTFLQSVGSSLDREADKASSPASTPLFIHAFSHLRDHTRLDLRSNLLRLTLQCHGALLGGANRVTPISIPPEMAAMDPDEARWARNVVHLLREESHVDEVDDPAFGSPAFAHATQQLYRQAWDIFCDIEERGGLLNGIREGWIQQVIQRQDREEQAAFLSGAHTMVGVNSYKTPFTETSTSSVTGSQKTPEAGDTQTAGNTAGNAVGSVGRSAARSMDGNAGRSPADKPESQTGRLNPSLIEAIHATLTIENPMSITPLYRTRLSALLEQAGEEVSE